jgi:Flp pilus assembly protein TadD
MYSIRRAGMMFAGLFAVATTACSDNSQDIKTCIMYPEDVKAAIAACTQLIDDPPVMDTTRHGWFAARGNHKRLAGDQKGAMADFNESIRLMPNDPQLYETRAELHAELGHADKADADSKKAERLRAKKR